MNQVIDNNLNGFLDENKEFQKFSLSLQEKLRKWDDCKKPIERPDWQTYFLSLANLVSKKSADARTKCGCVITTDTNEIISTGYNSFIRGIDDRILPNFTEEKYPFMIHSEINALLNAARMGKSTLNSYVYLNGPPCFPCLQAMWQAGVRRVYHSNLDIKMLNNQEYTDNIELFKYLTQGELPVILIDVKD